MTDKCLVINAGSSSLKFSLFEMPSEKLIANGVFERIGEKFSNWKLVMNTEKFQGQVKIVDHAEAFDLMKRELLNRGAISTLGEIKEVGHRVLHGGTLYNQSVVIDSEVLKNIQNLTDLGPLHHPGELKGIEAARNSFQDAVQVATFDTAFHQTIPEENYLYGTPYELKDMYGYRKYGFHGTSYQYITETMQEKLGKNDVNLIICHIGSGASIAAIKNGKSFDTTMGLTPEDGLLMGTRAGSLDPSSLEYLSKKLNKSLEEVVEILNKKSGLLGISGISNDYRDVEEAAKKGDHRAILALKMFYQRIVNFIVQYYNELDGNIDGIVFTAGVGENSSSFRMEVISQCAKTMPLVLDSNRNSQIAGFKEIKEGVITSSESLIPVYVIPTNEEIMIAREAYRLKEEKLYKKIR